MKNLLFLIFLLPLTLLAQSEYASEPFASTSRYHWAIHSHNIVPQGLFGQFSDRTVYPGLSIGGQFSSLRTPLVIGMNVNWNRLGNEAISYTGTIDGQAVPVQQSATSWMVGGDVFVRYLLPSWKFVRPYTDVFVQPTFVVFNDRLEDREFDETIYRETLESDFAVAYGASVGFLVALPRTNGVQLNFRLSYSLSNEVEYYLNDQNFTADPRLAFSSHQSALSAWQPQVGVLLPLYRSRTRTTRPRSRTRRPRQAPRRKPRTRSRS